MDYGWSHEGLELDLSMVVLTERVDGFWRHQFDRFGGQDGGGPSLEALMPFGLMGRPRDADQGPNQEMGPGADVVVFHHGSEGRAMPCGDPRYAALAPDPGAGGGGLYYGLLVSGAKAAAWLIFKGDDGSMEASVPVAGNKQHKITIDVNGSVVGLYHSDGALLEVGITGVDVGGHGGHNIMVDAGLLAWLTGFATAAAAVGVSVGPPPAAAVATKARAL